MGTIGFYGDQRNGKTISMVFMCYLYHVLGYVIVSNNRSLDFPHENFTNDMFMDEHAIDKIKKKHNTNLIVLAVDEIHLLLDARRGMKNAAKSFLITQAGKMLEEKGHFFFTTQHPRQIDVRLRENTSCFIHVKKLRAKGKTKFRWTFLYPEEDAFIPKKTKYINGDVMFNMKLYNTHEIIPLAEDW